MVPNVRVTITNKATGAVRTETANTEGVYSAPSLLPAEYEVRVEQAGFRTVVAPAQVIAGSTTTLDVNIMPGAPNEVVTVEATAVPIDYDSHTVQGVIQRETIEDLPLNGRSALQLASLEPGVTQVPGSTAQFNAMFNVSVFGAAAGATAGSGVGARLTMDGGVINDEMEGGTSMNFSQEVVQEFQLSTLNFDASTGIAASGAVNIITRSGTNQFHGSVYYFYRDHNIAANPSLAPASPFFQRKNPGFLIGGPIKKDKLFFFFNYEHLGQVAVLSEQEDLPSVRALSGVLAGALSLPTWSTFAWITTLKSRKHNFFVQVFTTTGNQGFGLYGALTPQPANFNYNKNWSDQSLMGLTSAFTPTLVNDLRFQFHYWENNVTDALPSDCPYPCVGFWSARHCYPRYIGSSDLRHRQQREFAAVPAGALL